MSAHTAGDVATLVEWLVHAVREHERARGYHGPANPATGAIPEEQAALFLESAKTRLMAVVRELESPGVTGHLDDSERAA